LQSAEIWASFGILREGEPFCWGKEDGIFYARKSAMKLIIAIALLVVGIVLLIMAYDSYHSAASGVSRAVTGAATDKTVWMLVGGLVATIVGVGGILSGGAKKI
jgi:Protein of unknown function (DUF3185)